MVGVIAARVLSELTNQQSVSALGLIEFQHMPETQHRMSLCRINFWLVANFFTGQQLCYSCGLNSNTMSIASTSASDCVCTPGYTQQGPGTCGTCLIRITAFKAEYLYELTMAKADGTSQRWNPTGLI